MALSVSPFPFSSVSPTFTRKTQLKVSFSLQIDPPKKKRKPRPTFADQIRDKWSIKNPNIISKPLPWELKNEIQVDEIEEEEVEANGSFGFKPTESIGSDSVSFANPDCVNLPPWIHGDIPERIRFANARESNVEKKGDFVGEFEGSVSSVNPRKVNLPPWVHGNVPKETQFESSSGINRENEANFVGDFDGFGKSYETAIGFAESSVESDSDVEYEASFVRESEDFVEINKTPIGFRKSSAKIEVNVENEANFVDKFDGFAKIDETPVGFRNSRVEGENIRMPWERERNSRRDGIAGPAESLIPETELRRLRNVAKRMVERIKVGSAGVNQELVDSIRERWREDEVVKLKFIGAPTLNMKRTHEALEVRNAHASLY